MKTLLESSPSKAQKKLWLEERRSRHHAALLTLYKGSKPTTGLALWRKVRKLEQVANDAATAQCNGAEYNGQPFRSEMGWSAFKLSIEIQLRSILYAIPVGFFVNGDPRGYALKLDNEKVKIPEGMFTDWGGYGCLAADIN